VALEGTDGPEPVVPDADDPDPEPPEPDPADPVPDDPDPESPDPDPADPVPDDPDPPEPVPDDPVVPDPEPSAVEPDGPELDDPVPFEAAAVFAIPAEQAERQNRERLKRPKRNCERREFNDSPNQPASAHADCSLRDIGFRPTRYTCTHTTGVGAYATLCLSLRANTTTWLRQVVAVTKLKAHSEVF